MRPGEAVCELRVTECLSATLFRKANLAAEGCAAVCAADIVAVRAFNPKIAFTRDKALMQGDDCCNHCFTMTE